MAVETPSAPFFDPEEALADGCLSVSEGVEFSGLSRATLYAEMDRGALVFVKVGRRRLIPKRSLVRFLAEGLRGGKGQ